MEKALKSHKILTRKSNALWDILLAKDYDAKKLAGNVLKRKTGKGIYGQS